MRHAHRDAFHEVCCPSCFQTFSVAGPHPHECPTEWDYDCEVCCRPMTIAFESDGDEVHADARGLDD
ncbi:CPXCG motif-containing cysteine-rich protein [Congregicoccus parvus]|uniref:CPXCG motif-containing cysteine-rich protein n=1 Tax=Congregicoccus parvus TaxID=3081749 RepID=UPI003FA52E2C